jgi:3-hydroxy-9,10-secoandrosta-1,3,5(10)-triene-9,17-dione monooxygenase reductase component
MPTAVTVVATVGGDGPLGATAGAVASLSLEPLLMLACLDRESRTLEAIGEVRRFSVNVLAADQEDVARRLATKDPHAEKWAPVEWSEELGVPRIEGTPLWAACELADRHEGGDHVILTGAVLAVRSAPVEPLLFHAGAYRRLGA